MNMLKIRLDATSGALSKILPMLLTVAALGACESSYDEAAEAFYANRAPTPDPTPTPPPPAPPPGSSFGPNFSEIQANVFTPTCATSGCHAGSNPAASLNLEAANSYAMLVGVASTQDAGIQRVNPNNPNLSYLIQKMEGTAATGNVMPPTGSIEQADIDIVRQWITDGAIDDTAAPPAGPIRVTTLSIAPNSTLNSTPGQITAGFDRELDASTVNANTFILEGSNGDGIFDDGDDMPVTAASITVPGTNPQSAVFSLSGITLADDTYRIRLLGSGASVIMDLDANALDGEFSCTFPSGNGVAGGNFSSAFTVTTPVTLGPTLDQIQAVIFTPSCATAGCHNGTTMAAGLSLADADTSYGELVGEFSNQAGQMNVLLVAPGDPDASYLIRKMENAAGITGNVMPPPGRTPIPQADIDQIRLWITNGAQR